MESPGTVHPSSTRIGRETTYRTKIFFYLCAFSLILLKKKKQPPICSCPACCSMWVFELTLWAHRSAPVKNTQLNFVKTHICAYLCFDGSGM
uniref:Uncharacterized protein n=1 Tax=Apteryx owenii TaxID=8824 RepID=A0A8B9SD72_APTOW